MNNNEPKMGFRVVLAVFLSFLVILVINITFKDTKNVNNLSKIEETKKETKELSSEDKTKDIDTILNKSKKESQKEIQKEIQEEKISVETEKYILEFSNKGGIITKIQIKDFLWNDLPMDLTPSESSALSVSFDGSPLWYNYNKEKNSLVFWAENDTYRIEKIYTFTNKYNIGLKINLYAKTNYFQSKIMVYWGKGLGPIIEEDKRTRYDEEIVTSYFDVDKNSEVKVDKKIEEKKRSDWVSIDNRYFIAAILPENRDEYSIYINNEGIYRETIGIGKEFSLKEKDSFSLSYNVYIGPKNEMFLKEMRNLDVITERGFAPITLIAKWIKALLFLLNSLFNNFGISIMFLSLIFNIILNPLSRKSMEASRKMQALQPQIEALKKKYKDPKELNAKIWELYRREKISPASGCLPMLLQLPFFFALYAVLPYVIELKNTTFLWIKDLSSPDTVYYIQAFKDFPILPYRLNVLPLILTFVSFFQTKLSQGGHPSTSQGRFMEFIMPIVFLFIFWNMPSGLVLYWIIQTLFTILVQYIINHRKKKNKRKQGDKK